MKALPRSNASAIHAGIVQTADCVLVWHDDHRLALDVYRIGIVVVDRIAVPQKTFISQDAQGSLRVAHARSKPTCDLHAHKVLKHLGTGPNLFSLLFLRKMNQLKILSVGVANNFMPAFMNRLHRLGITMDTKRVGIKRSLHAVLFQDPQDAPDTRPPAIVILACRPAIVKRDNIVFLDGIRPADMMCPPMLGIRNLSP